MKRGDEPTGGNRRNNGERRPVVLTVERSRGEGKRGEETKRGGSVRFRRTKSNYGMVSGNHI